MVAPSIVDERPSRERQLIRFLAFALVVLVGISGLTARLVYLQFVRGQVYQAQAEQNRTVTQAIPSTRGLIYDRKGRLLVSNEPTYAIKIRPSDLPFTERDEVVGRLAALLGMDVADINLTIDSNPGSRFDLVRIAQDVPIKTANLIAEARLALPGVEVDVESKRHYVEGPLMSQIIGYTGAIDADTLKAIKDQGYQPDDLIGQAGVESTYESDVARGVRAGDGRARRPGPKAPGAVDESRGAAGRLAHPHDRYQRAEARREGGHLGDAPRRAEARRDDRREPADGRDPGDGEPADLRRQQVRRGDQPQGLPGAAPEPRQATAQPRDQ